MKLQSTWNVNEGNQLKIKLANVSHHKLFVKSNHKGHSAKNSECGDGEFYCL